MTKNRRRFFFINKPLQLRFMLYVTAPLVIITLVIMAGLYVGIWGSMLDSFSDEQLRADLLTASRLTEYEEARLAQNPDTDKTLLFFKQAERLSNRQKEVFKDILDHSNKKIIPKFGLLLILIAWGSIYVSHKIAGPLYRFRATLEDIQKGNLRARIHLRKADEGKILARRFNDALLSLDQTFGRLKIIIRENESDPERMTEKLKEELSKIKTSADS